MPSRIFALMVAIALSASTWAQSIYQGIYKMKASGGTLTMIIKDGPGRKLEGSMLLRIGKAMWLADLQGEQGIFSGLLVASWRRVEKGSSIDMSYPRFEIRRSKATLTLSDSPYGESMRPYIKQLSTLTLTGETLKGNKLKEAMKLRADEKKYFAHVLKKPKSIPSLPILTGPRVTHPAGATFRLPQGWTATKMVGGMGLIPGDKDKLEEYGVFLALHSGGDPGQTATMFDTYWQSSGQYGRLSQPTRRHKGMHYRWQGRNDRDQEERIVLLTKPVDGIEIGILGRGAISAVASRESDLQAIYDTLIPAVRTRDRQVEGRWVPDGVGMYLLIFKVDGSYERRISESEVELGRWFTDTGQVVLVSSHPSPRHFHYHLLGDSLILTDPGNESITYKRDVTG
jgi:hypothetical protein